MLVQEMGTSVLKVHLLVGFLQSQHVDNDLCFPKANFLSVLITFSLEFRVVIFDYRAGICNTNRQSCLCAKVFDICDLEGLYCC